MSEIQDFFVELKAKYPHEYRVDNLEAATIPVVIPLVSIYRVFKEIWFRYDNIFQSGIL